jgi:hypothetical protein
MRFITTRAHGVIDYVMGVLIMASPWFLGFARGGAETWVPVIVGGAGLVYSLFTRYELGVVKSITMPVHLMLDLLSGIFLALSPWIFGFSDEVYMPHLIFGILEVGPSLTTQRVPSANVSGARGTTRTAH